MVLLVGGARIGLGLIDIGRLLSLSAERKEAKTTYEQCSYGCSASSP
jgi:hypothetical protein